MKRSFRARELTPPGRGAVSVLGLEGPGALAAAAALLGRDVPLGRPLLARLELDGEFVDEVLVVAQDAQHCELHLHGSPPLVQRVLAALDADPDERAQVALEERAAALLPEAACEAAARMLLDQSRGALRRALEALLALDDRQLDAGLAPLLDTERVARALLRPSVVVLAGPVNAGKSTLFNVLLGRERALTGAEPGTTRDILREPALFGDWPVIVCDTAGERAVGEASVEQAGQQRARRAAAEADLVLWLAPPGAAPPVPPGEPGPRTRVLATQADRAPRAGAISALRAPEAARARVHALFVEALGLPARAWTPGAALLFEAELARALRAARGTPALRATLRRELDFGRPPAAAPGA